MGLVMEWAAPTLYYFLSDLERPEDLPWTQRWTIAQQIAEGMRFLHGQDIVHHDLRTVNVLVGDKPRVCRLADFGLSKCKKQSSIHSTNRTGNSHWLAPEYASPHTDKPLFTQACDVFSFGVLLFEVVTGGGLPFATDPPDLVTKRYGHGQQCNQIPDDVPDAFKAMMWACWALDPQKRPDFEQILQVESVAQADPFLYI
eukprot:NODE_581_length_1530_cov_41.226874_g425_i0.p1 GENE.NODE_581_length_1530_cov_41.226874_g425_i0~~NODE_581_length_1530_cov_41.226874_g425_i0.p1  ORF type:complete len:200 (+),score=30.94 NODE_581_length_1530_cov_41.226874_g425_i0:599-1198(+)